MTPEEHAAAVRAAVLAEREAILAVLESLKGGGSALGKSHAMVWWDHALEAAIDEVRARGES